MKKCSVGGQAVMEGVMMKAPGGIAMAVRDAKGRIILDYKEYQTKAQKGTFYGLPIVRGVVAFVESLTIGMNTLTRYRRAHRRPHRRGAHKIREVAVGKAGQVGGKGCDGPCGDTGRGAVRGAFLPASPVYKQPYIQGQRRCLRHKVPCRGAGAAMHFYRLHTLAQA